MKPVDISLNGVKPLTSVFSAPKLNPVYGRKINAPSDSVSDKNISYVFDEVIGVVLPTSCFNQ